MTVFTSAPHAVSVTEASARGVSSLVRSAERGEDVVVERHGKPVAAIVSMTHMEEIDRLERDLRESVLLLARLATDDGARTDLDSATEVYSEVQDRVSKLESAPATIPLAEALSALGKAAYGMKAAAESGPNEVPAWLIHTLTGVVKMPRSEVDRLTHLQAQQIWDDYISSPRP